MSRVLIIGLDGATFDLVSPMIREGKLPNMERLVSNGTSAVLESTPFPHSAPAWASCITGVNPGKHGVFGFGVRDESNSYRFKLPNSTTIRAKTLPLLLTESGKCSGLMNVPLSYPPHRINGFIISGMLTPRAAESFTFPPGLQQELLGAVPDYVTEAAEASYFDRTHAQGKAAYAEALFNSIRARTKAAKLLMEKENWDLFMVVFTESDRVQHLFWAEMEEFHLFHHEKDESLSSTISKTYQRLDESIGILLDDLSRDTQVLVISDHGFGPQEKLFYLNKFLEERGFLKLISRKYPEILKAIKGVVKGFPGVGEAHTRLSRLQQKTQRYVQSKRQKIEGWVAEEIVDWGKTKAFADHYGIRINMEGREPSGIIAPGKEAHDLMEELMDQLLDLKFPHNGKSVFTHIQKSSNVYSGPFVDKAPDLITFMDVGRPHPAYTAKELFGDSLIGTGGHSKDGIFIAWGEKIKKGQRLQRASIIDITPTVCYALGIPLTPEMDGVVLDMFKEGLDAGKVADRRGTSMPQKADQATYTTEQESEIEERLKNLGYLD